MLRYGLCEALAESFLDRAMFVTSERAVKVFYKTVMLGDPDIFYREAGPKDGRVFDVAGNDVKTPTVLRGRANVCNCV
jgi:hypothetical protein